MICPECRDDDHEHCYDKKHHQQAYRGCACQRHPRQDEPAPPPGRSRVQVSEISRVAPFALLRAPLDHVR